MVDWTSRGRSAVVKNRQFWIFFGVGAALLLFVVAGEVLVAGHFIAKYW